MSYKKISVVVSVYNEEQSLHNFYSDTLSVLENIVWDYELIFVNDGSTDNSRMILDSFAKENKKVKVLNFSRNFGHEAAMIAGIDHSAGDGIVCMDADLQHPPEIIPEIVEKLDDGFEIISMVRRSRKKESLLRKLPAVTFYKLLNMLSPIKFENNSSDFFAFSKRVATILKKDYRENVRYLRGFVQSVGFKKTTLSFEAQERAFGESKYNLAKLIKFSMATICSFSDMPLKLGIYSGLVVALFGVILMIYTIIEKIIHGAPSGYSTIIVAMSFMFGIVLCVIGIIGQYISVLFSEIKNRPIYILDDTKNLEEK